MDICRVFVKCSFQSVNLYQYILILYLLYFHCVVVVVKHQQNQKPPSQTLIQQEEEEEVGAEEKLYRNCKLIYHYFYLFRSKRYHERMKAKKKKALEEILDVESGDYKVPKLRTLKVNLHIKSNFNSFVQQRSSQVRKLLKDQPTTAIAILRHVWDQLYKDPKMRVLMNKYWKRNDEGSLAKLMLDMGKYKSQKDDKKLSATVNMIKKKYNTLRQACQLTDISWTHFHRHTYVKSKPHRKLEYTRRLTSSNIQDIKNHFNCDDISFFLPDKKYANKRFMRTSILK